MNRPTFPNSRVNRKNPQTLLSEKFVAYLIKEAGLESSQIGFRDFTKYHGDKSHCVEPIEVVSSGASPHLTLRLFNTHVFRDYRISSPPDKFADIVEAAERFFRPR